MPSRTLNRRAFLGASFALVCLPSRLFADERSSEVVLRFCAMSDVHFDRSHNDDAPERARLRKAIEFMNGYSKTQPYDRFDALLVAGDFSNHGESKELEPFKRILDENLSDSTARVLCMGNHEFYGGSREYWESVFETNANRRREINGYQFITISPEKGTCRDKDYVYLREWLSENLKAACEADPAKPIFVVQHYHVYDTVYGSQNKPGDFPAGTSDLIDILQRYPQVVHISGHSHVPSFDPRAIWQGDFTCVGTGSMSYFALMTFERERNFQLGSNVRNREAGSFLLFEVYQDNAIRVRIYDTISDSFLDREYLIADPKDVSKYVYTNKRFENATTPRWRDDSAAEIVEIAPRAVTARFGQAVDDFCVVSYRIVVEKRKNETWEETGVHYVWSDYFMKKPAEYIEYDVEGLEPQSAYRLKIYATGAFQKETFKPIVVEFQTSSFEQVGRNEPSPRGDFLDVVFRRENGIRSAVGNDDSPLDAVEIGVPQIVADEKLGDVARFNGLNQCYLLPFSSVRAANFDNQITTLVKFRLDLTQKRDEETVSIFGATESGGLGFEYHPRRKQLVARCWINDNYRDLVAPFESQEETTAVFVYDGKETSLYLNGELVASDNVQGEFRFTRDSSARAFCVGGDACPNGLARWFFPGVIANARVYSYALSREQVVAVSK